MENVPSVTMMEGSLRLIASSPFTRPSEAPKTIPAIMADHGLRPATMSKAAMTAEKLNIQPTERSISRIASRNTMPRDSMPWNVVLPSTVKKLIGLRKRGLANPITAIMTMSATMTPVSSGSRNHLRLRASARRAPVSRAGAFHRDFSVSVIELLPVIVIVDRADLYVEGTEHSEARRRFQGFLDPLGPVL
jgi:hypothetical protein